MFVYTVKNAFIHSKISNNFFVSFYSSATPLFYNWSFVGGVSGFLKLDVEIWYCCFLLLFKMESLVELSIRKISNMVSNKIYVMNKNNYCGRAEILTINCGNRFVLWKYVNNLNSLLEILHTFFKGFFGVPIILEKEIVERVARIIFSRYGN